MDMECILMNSRKKASPRKIFYLLLVVSATNYQEQKGKVRHLNIFCNILWLLYFYVNYIISTGHLQQVC